MPQFGPLNNPYFASVAGNPYMPNPQDASRTGQQAGSNLNTDPVYDFGQKDGITLSPDEQLERRRRAAQNAAEDAFNQQMAASAYQAGLGNTIQNLNTQRSLAINAQTNAANNVANQLAGLEQARNSAATAIGNAMSTTAGMFR